MRAAKYDKRITIQRKRQELDDTNTPYVEWVTAFKRWAEFRSQSSTERFIENKESTSGGGVIAVRYDKHTQTITDKDRIVFNNRLFEITGLINPNEDNIELEMFYEEII